MTHLFQIRAAALAFSQVPFETRPLVSVQPALEVVADQLDELLTRKLFDAACVGLIVSQNASRFCCQPWASAVVVARRLVSFGPKLLQTDDATALSEARSNVGACRQRSRPSSVSV